MARFINPFTDVSALSKEERIKYDRALKRYRDTYNAMTGAEQKGRAEGIEEAKRENALRMKTKGYPVEDIAEITGLDAETINGL